MRYSRRGLSLLLTMVAANRSIDDNTAPEPFLPASLLFPQFFGRVTADDCQAALSTNPHTK
jgi:hypothetical protein